MGTLLAAELEPRTLMTRSLRGFFVTGVCIEGQPDSLRGTEEHIDVNEVWGGALGKNRVAVSAFAFVAVLGVGATVGCQNNNQILEADAAIVALAGTWEAAVFEFTSQTEPPVVRDLIEEGGSATLNLSINGAYTFTVVAPGEEEDVTRGFMVVEGSVLLVSDTSVPGETTAYDMSFDGDTLTLTTTEVGFDFNNDSVSDAATLRLVLERTQG